MTYTDNRDRFPSARTGQEGDDDTPLTDLRMLDITEWTVEDANKWLGY